VGGNSGMNQLLGNLCSWLHDGHGGIGLRCNNTTLSIPGMLNELIYSATQSAKGT
jgi:hypothetical protein